MKTLFMRSSAEISPCGLYRYSLSRTWDESLPVVAWLMLNPSTANAEQDDPTIRRLLGFAHGWHFGGIVVVNLFAYRSRSPDALRRAAAIMDIVGPDNDAAILRHTEGRKIVVGWGNHGRMGDRDCVVLDMLECLDRAVHCLGVNADGSPCHPLFVPASRELILYPMEGEG